MMKRLLLFVNRHRIGVLILCALTGMVISGWALRIHPEAIEFYRPYPPYQAIVITYSGGHTILPSGRVVNDWVWPTIQFVNHSNERPAWATEGEH